ncbi:putative OMPDCase-OPRTase [Leishmania major strain Friedlin]|uniref:Orotidine 5'-phosphate decarboxylase n=1 Tax=Leishmania major TaxID=5664 RepID=Q4QEW5_LEIMA|nr:putative OMPDCase-OPRTase [Leishmania major strain Friedlin]CAG9572089.1 orotidine-5-phosphate_decarboxylase/orotate_phosphoribosyltransferase_-_putative [Leishmania major strain Friedlin]CAJ03559.1 putative OMPDCase-OPRTase [Leishmania major strain Friedlin]|eukprot:XP_001682133.1 putative OMPDCase-OPRTase [Leishmania major strain Friedlin]
MSFFDLLNARAKRSLLCVGLDPRAKTATAAAEECKRLIEQTHEYAAAYKPNAAFFEFFGAEGWAALSEVIRAVPAGIPVVLDAKRGDIADTADAYATSAFKHLNAHAITASPYMGSDSLQPFMGYPDKAVFVLCKTSNKGSDDLQCLRVGDKYLYEAVAERAEGPWNVNGNVGLVVGATDPVALARVRARAPTLWFLVPGIGAQGGSLKASLDAGLRADGSGMLINVSRGLARAADPRAAAKELCEEINAIRFAKGASVELAKALVDSHCVRFGNFTLKSGKSSPIYIDLRRLVTYPAIMRLVAREYAKVLRHYKFDRIAGLPYAALPIASAISNEMNVPLIYPRREAKIYGTKAAIEGEYKKGDRVVIIDDLVSTGETKVEAIEKLRSAGLEVVSIVVLVDRDMGAKAFLSKLGYDFEAVVGLHQLLPLWRKSNAITSQQEADVRAFLGQWKQSKL